GGQRRRILVGRGELLQFPRWRLIPQSRLHQRAPLLPGLLLDHSGRRLRLGITSTAAPLTAQLLLDDTQSRSGSAGQFLQRPYGGWRHRYRIGQRVERLWFKENGGASLRSGGCQHLPTPSPDRANCNGGAI